jgi:glucose/arabinose dehydrogenase
VISHRAALAMLIAAIGRRSALALLVVSIGGVDPVRAATPYVPVGTCAGFPRLSLAVPRGWCVALVADASSGLVFPRRIVEVAAGRFWIVDMGGWEPGRGRLLQLELPAQGAAPPIALKVIADKLDRPHGIALGPDGRVYVGEAGRIWRTPAKLPVVAETVIEGLPADGAHPLKELVFGDRGRLFVNVGSSSDACRDDAGALPLPCPDRIGARPRAAVYEATLGGSGFTLQSFKPYATGLRNSLALAWTAPGALLQGENSIDYPDEDAPPEELNVLAGGSDHGWPYCIGRRQAARGYEGRVDCAGSAAPAMLWPAHVAPLQMLAVPAAANNAFAGQVIVAWHGYRAAGHRVVGFKVDASGVPTGAPRVWIGGWNAAKGVRPLGAPAGIFVDSAGRLLLVEDRNRTLLMLTRDDVPSRAASAPPTTIR